MKIRTGFVTNSSSTNFLILSKNELNAEDLCKEMGFSPESDYYSLGLELCTNIIYATERNCLYHGDLLGNLTERIVEIEFGKDSAIEFAKRKKQGWHIYYGYTSSDEGGLTSFFTTDSILFKSRNLYIDGRDCTW